jgi:poly(3-hydroxybutyrate) depolymerase
VTHRRPRAVALLVLALCAALASASAPLRAQDAPAVKLPAWKAGEQEGVVRIDEKDERFVALVPKGYSPKKPVAAVLLLHGNGGRAADFLRTCKTFTDKPPLLVALERCDNNQDAVGFTAKYLAALRAQFALDDTKLFAVGFSGGGFRLWDDVVCKAEEATRFRGVVLVGSARQSFDPPEKPAAAPTVVLVGDPKDSNFTEPGPAGEKALAAKGWDVVVLEHTAGHSMPPAQMKAVFGWIEDLVAGRKTTLATTRLGADGKAPKGK